ncbi:hypothetical protein GGD82_003838 [Roseospira marina]|nr:hypothetical protein [Roseospira marina]
MAETPGVAGSPPPPLPARGEAVRLSVPGVDDRGTRGPRAEARTSDLQTSEERRPPHIIRFQGRELDPDAPRGTYLDITV